MNKFKIKLSAFKLSKKFLCTFSLLILGLIYICYFVKIKINDTLEQHLQNQIEIISLITTERIEREMTRTNAFANYLETHPDNIGEIVNNMESAKERFKQRGFSSGILSTDFIPIQGERLNPEQFVQLPKVLQGTEIIDYCAGQGLLFAEPVYSEDKVEYIVYNLFEESALANKFGLKEDADKDHIIIKERGGDVIIPYPDYGEADENFFSNEEVKQKFDIIEEKLLTQKSAIINCNFSMGNHFLFGVTLPKTNFIIIGYVTWESAAGNIFILNFLLLGIIAVLSIGSIIFFKMSERARESEEKKLMAEQASKAKSAFLANMSHDIRTPLGEILGFNEILLRECKDPRFHKYAQNIEELGETLLMLIKDILDLSKIESGHMELQSQEYHLNEIIRNIINMIMPRSDKKNLQFNVQVNKNIPNRLLGDSIQIQRVITNFLTNAVKYTPCGGVELFVEYDSGADEKSIFLRFIVKDTGIGIREEDMDKLFAQFKRLDLQKNGHIEGTGLGLALSNELVNLMNGRIEVKSVYGEGTTFVITLPQKILSNEPIGNFRENMTIEKTALQQTENIKFIAPNAKVLLVDDDEVNLEVYTNMLERLQIQIDTASSGAECLEKIKQQRYDEIFLDQMMPGFGGSETLKRSKVMSDNLCRDVPIIAFTANAILGIREKLLAEGFTDYLSKPVRGKELETMIYKHLSEDKIQLLPNDEVDEIDDENENEEQSEIPIAIIKGKYIDPEIGLEYCDYMEDVYLKTLATFCRVKEEKQRNLEETFANENWADYTTFIHSVKSTSMTIGCPELSKAAKSLELAGDMYLSEYVSEEKKEEGIAYIRQHHAEVMNMYDEVVDEGIKILEEFNT